MGRLNESVMAAEGMLVGMVSKASLQENLGFGRASMRIIHQRPQDYKLVRPETIEAAFHLPIVG